MDMIRRAVAESVGTALLLLAIVGSGIMAERLCGGNAGLALLANGLATAGALVAIVLTFGPISGAHLNPVVTLALAWRREFAWRDAPAYIGAQLGGAVVGTVLADVTFGVRPVSFSHHVRGGSPLLLGESVATFGLLFVVLGCARSNRGAVAYAVAAYITGAYWFTPSTSFANPAVTIGRSLSDTFAGIRPNDVPAFVIAELLGATAATTLAAYLLPCIDSVRTTLLPRQEASLARNSVN